MESMTPASDTGFQAKSAAEKCVSYMWYVHVLVSINTEDRLRANIAPHLATAASMTSGPGPLTDHLVLWLFNHTILARLVSNAPVFAQADGYTHILSDIIPTALCEEFCRRLYTLLFSKGIVEWPHGIDVPEPAILAAEPVVVVDVPVELADTHLSPPRYYWGDNGTGTGLDGTVEEGEHDLRQESAVSPKSGARTLWPRTPSMNSWGDGDDSHMQRGMHFGTVESPLPWNDLSEGGRCNNKDTVHDIDRRGVLGEQPVSPVPSPHMQSRRTDSTEFETPTWSSRFVRRQRPPPHAQQQGHDNKTTSMYSDDIERRGRVVGQSSQSVIGARRCRFGHGRVGWGPTAPNQPIGDDQLRLSDCDWDRRGGTPATGSLRVPAHRLDSSPITGFPALARRTDAAEAARLSLSEREMDMAQRGKTWLC